MNALSTLVPSRTTRHVAGYDLTLIPGRNYLASRPFAGEQFPLQRYDIHIIDVTEGYGYRPIPEITLSGLTYYEAGRFLAAFNAGPFGLSGRQWV